MALAININDLLNKQKIESNRIEFKKGWNPSSIYHSVCAFANDFDDLGGGYILVGVDTDKERTFFRITIPCHETAGNIIADIAHKDDSLRASKRGVLKTGLKSGLESGLKSGLKILEHIQNNPQSTLIEIAKQTGYSRSWVAETMKRLQEEGVIKRVGSDRSGYWVIVNKYEQ